MSFMIVTAARHKFDFGALSAILCAGSVVTWSHCAHGCHSSAVQDELRNVLQSHALLVLLLSYLAMDQWQPDAVLTTLVSALLD